MRRVLLTLLGLFFFQTAHATLSDIQLSVPDTTVARGDTISIPMMVSDLTGLEVISYQFKLYGYDPELEYVDAVSGGSLSSDGTVLTNTVDDTVLVSAIFTEDMTGQGDLIYLRFLPLQSGTVTLSLSEAIFNTTETTNTASGTAEIIYNPPVIDNFSDITFDEDASATVDLDAYGSDPYYAVGDLNWQATVIGNSVLSSVINAETNTLTLEADPDSNGVWELALALSNPAGKSDHDTIQVTVESVNDAPAIQPLPDTTLTEHSTITITIDASDVESSVLAYSAFSSTTTVQTTLDGNSLTVTSDTTWYGSALISAVASDGELADTTSFTYQVAVEERYGDVDDNGSVQSFDAALALQHSVGLDPLPESDPVPWSDWRYDRADVDLNGEIQAYDASLIQEYVVSILDTLPDASGTEGEPSISPELQFTQQGASLVMQSVGTQNIFGLNILLEYVETQITFADIQPSDAADNYDSAVNTSVSNQLRAGYMTVDPPAEDGTFLTIPFELSENSSVAIKYVINAMDTIEATVNLTTRTDLTAGEGNIPERTRLYENYPNPFNPTTSIKYDLATASPVHIYVADVLGRHIATLVREKQAAGHYTLTWSGRTEAGRKAGSGVYFLILTTQNNRQIRKMILLQ